MRGQVPPLPREGAMNEWLAVSPQAQAAHGDQSAELRCQGTLADSNRQYQLDCPTLQGQFAASAKKTVQWRNDAPLRARWMSQG